MASGNNVNSAWRTQAYDRYGDAPFVLGSEAGKSVIRGMEGRVVMIKSKRKVVSSLKRARIVTRAIRAMTFVTIKELEHKLKAVESAIDQVVARRSLTYLITVCTELPTITINDIGDFIQIPATQRT
jgi:hypothetical protein